MAVFATTWLGALLSVDDVEHPLPRMPGAELCPLSPRYAERRLLDATRVSTLPSLDVFEVEHLHAGCVSAEMSLCGFRYAERRPFGCNQGVHTFRS